MKVEVALEREDSVYWEASAKSLSPTCFAFGITKEAACQTLLETIFMELALKACNGAILFQDDGLTIEIALKRDPK